MVLTNFKYNQTGEEMGKLVYGVGINDVDYAIDKRETIGYIDGKQKRKLIWVCPYYSKWTGMLARCYSGKWQNKYPTYIGCTVHPDWCYLSNFIKWVENQPNRDWVSCNLDKDFLLEGNKHYSPTTCVFISKGLNTFITDSGAIRGDYLIGVCRDNRNGKFLSQCNDPFKVENRYLGSFDLEIEAHLAWKAKKHEYACKLADLQDDERVAEVLRTKYKF